MSLRDAIGAIQNAPTKPRCRVGQVLVELDDDVHDELIRAIDDPSLTSAAIATALCSIGVDCREYSVQRHRRGICLCPR